ncbi:MAG: hypothetical protein WBO76_14475 [Saprospiraceae bacterium]
MRFINNPNYLIFILFLLTFIPKVILGQWSQIGSSINGEAAGDESGFSVSLSSNGNRLAVGAYLNDANGTNSGSVRVYKNNSGNWVQVGLDINGENANDRSGHSVSLSADGTRIAIGANFNSENGYAAGHVRVYEEIGGSWIQIGGDIDGEAGGDQSGYSVSLSEDGKRVAIGAPANEGNGSGSGQCRVYKEVAGVWIKIGADLDGEAIADESGYAVSLSGDGKKVAIGAHFNDGNGHDVGHVRVYKENMGSWVKVGNDIDGEGPEDYFGNSVSLSFDGTRLVIGGPHNDGSYPNAGHARIYEEIFGNWMQIGTDIDGEGAEDESGNFVSLSSDGNHLVIGAIKNDGNGIDAGHVRVYKYYSGSWIQVNNDIDGENIDDWSGNSVSISADGSRIAVGARFNDNNGSNSGNVRVFGCINIYNATDMIYYCSLEDALAASATDDGDEIQIPAGNYSLPCIKVNKSITLTPVGGTVTIGCLTMNGSGKILEMDGNIQISTLTLITGKISTNGYNLKCGAISGGNSLSYIVTD